jgi:hypothetical protein
MPTGVIRRFYRPFQHGTADGGTQLSGIMEKGKTALNGTFFTTALWQRSVEK